MNIALKRVYDPAEPSDGYRILVDRIWPRGISQEDARVDLWMRDVAPSTELRQWFGHDPQRWEEFRTRYTAELGAHGELLDLILDSMRHRKRVTLLFAASDTEHNQAVVLLDALTVRTPHVHH